MWISTTRLSMTVINPVRQLTRKTINQLQPCLRWHVNLILGKPTGIEQDGKHGNAHTKQSMLIIIYMLSDRAVTSVKVHPVQVRCFIAGGKTCWTCQTADVKAAASTSLCCCAEGDELSTCWLSITAAKTCACTPQSCSNHDVCDQL